MKLEFCIQSHYEALAAKKYGARRVELCSALELGGLTPSLGLIRACREIGGVEVHVLVRPRQGNFNYSPREFEIMKSDIQTAADAGCHGVVIGILNEKNELDLERNELLVDLAISNRIEATFHRAFDFVKDTDKTLEDLIKIGFTRLLTSGMNATAIGGIEVIRHLVNLARGRIEIMAGGGISETNVCEFKKCGVNAVHFSVGKPDAAVGMSMGRSTVVDTDKIESIIKALNGN